ncbi:4'-phosphopantetheinyl transferase family protein [Microbacterium trichothecenolyticum]|uniref:Phosphopantetheinyl transferase n=1 Tax=Microbacterium trichothecenolyticum TaxID=69370 RepID=A0ABU0TRR1_MICTR|nr:hypothetical protein [Microbacterium trichothecenolyticum]MDQ1122338.1 phosphopantetheinyl transferase [Microbacterium trichothecenolyticum]
MIVAARALEPGHPWLSSRERARLEVMRPARAAEFTTGRVLARVLVAAATGRAPGDVTIAVRPAGDPRAGMPWTPDAAGGISIAHSGGVVLVAYRSEGDVGVDVEAGIGGASRPALPTGTRPATATDAATDAVAAYLPAAERPHAGWTSATLATAWVRREAVVKCLGVGLVADPEHLTLAPADARPAVVACGLAPAAELALVDLDVGGLPGALAVRAEASSLPGAERLGIPSFLPEVVDAGDLVPGADGVGIRLSVPVGV